MVPKPTKKRKGNNWTHTKNAKKRKVGSNGINDNSNIRIVLGEYNQSNQRFGSYAGKQCTAIAVTACVALNLKNASDWEPLDIHTVLDVGNALYGVCLGRERLRCDTDIMYLEFQDVDVPEIIIFNTRVFLSILDNQGMHGHLTNNGDAGFHNLEQTLVVFFESYQYGGLTVNSRSIAIHKSVISGHFHYFDSHSLDDQGRSCADGCAGLVTFETIEGLHALIISNHLIQSDRENANIFSLIPIRVNERVPHTENVPTAVIRQRRVSPVRPVASLSRTVALQQSKETHPPVAGKNVALYSLNAMSETCKHFGAQFFSGEVQFCCNDGKIVLNEPTLYPGLIVTAVTNAHVDSLQ